MQEKKTVLTIKIARENMNRLIIILLLFGKNKLRDCLYCTKSA